MVFCKQDLGKTGCNYYNHFQADGRCGRRLGEGTHCRLGGVSTQAIRTRLAIHTRFRWLDLLLHTHILLMA